MVDPWDRKRTGVNAAVNGQYLFVHLVVHLLTLTHIDLGRKQCNFQPNRLDAKYQRLYFCSTPLQTIFNLKLYRFRLVLEQIGGAALIPEVEGADPRG